MSLLDSVVVGARNVTHPDRLVTFWKGDVCSEVEWNMDILLLRSKVCIEGGDLMPTTV